MVGFCVDNLGPASISNNDWVNGWVMVTTDHGAAAAAKPAPSNPASADDDVDPTRAIRTQGPREFGANGLTARSRSLPNAPALHSLCTHSALSRSMMPLNNGVSNTAPTTGWFIFSSPAVANGMVYIGSYNKKVYALNALSGTLLWSYTTGQVVGSSTSAPVTARPTPSTPRAGRCCGPSPPGAVSSAPRRWLTGWSTSAPTTTASTRSTPRAGRRFGPTPPGASSFPPGRWPTGWSTSVPGTTTSTPSTPRPGPCGGPTRQGA
jgi:hypothetical protein